MSSGLNGPHAHDLSLPIALEEKNELGGIEELEEEG
jgi:hypothetical protein